MQTVVIVVHLMVVLALVGVILIQRSEGGGLGIGGGSGFMTARGAANALTRATGILAAAFFATALGLSVLARYGGQPGDILNRVTPAPAQQGTPGNGAAGNGGGGVLNQLGGGNTEAPAPAQPAAPSGASDTALPAAPATGAATAPATATAPAAPAPSTPQVPSGQ